MNLGPLDPATNPESFDDEQRRLFQEGLERIEADKAARLMRRQYRRLQHQTWLRSAQALIAFSMAAGHLVLIVAQGPIWFGAAFGWSLIYLACKRRRQHAIARWRRAIHTLPEARLLPPPDPVGD